MTVEIGIEWNNEQGVLIQGRAITSSRGGVAVIPKAVNMNTNALYVARSRTEDFIAQNGGREKSHQKNLYYKI